MSDAADRLKNPVERAALLAAFAAGRATPEDVAAIRKAQESAPQLAAELELFKATRERILETQEPTPGEWGWQRLRRDLSRGRQDKSAWLPAAAAAVLAVVIVQGVLWWRAEPPGYAPLGNAQSPGIVIQLRFRPDAKQGDIERLLKTVDAEFVAGPAASGLYRIRLGDDGPEAQRRALAALRERKDIVDYAERQR